MWYIALVFYIFLANETRSRRRKKIMRRRAVKMRRSGPGLGALALKALRWHLSKNHRWKKHSDALKSYKWLDGLDPTWNASPPRAPALLIMKSYVVGLRMRFLTPGDSKRAAHGVSLFLVDADTPGFHKGRWLCKPSHLIFLASYLSNNWHFTRSIVKYRYRHRRNVMSCRLTWLNLDSFQFLDSFQSPPFWLKDIIEAEQIDCCFPGRKLQKLGLKSQDTAELFFEDVSRRSSSRWEVFTRGDVSSGESARICSARSWECRLLSTDGTTAAGIFYHAKDIQLVHF